MTEAIEAALSKRSSSEAALILREYSHRINNEFASAISVISVAAGRSKTDEAKDALHAIKDQLLNYAQVHHVLQIPEHDIRVEATAYLRQLCRAISKSKLDGRGIELQLVGRKVNLSSERCWRLGLIVSELVTNAARHAFDGGGGSIRVRIRPVKSIVRCQVTDDGKATGNIRAGRGLKIIAELAKSLGGTFDQRFGSHGSLSVLKFPIRGSESERRTHTRSNRASLGTRVLAGHPKERKR